MSPPPAVWGRTHRLHAVHFDHVAVLAAHDDDGLPDTDPLVRVELLERRQGVIRVAVILEGDGDGTGGTPTLRHQLGVI